MSKGAGLSAPVNAMVAASVNNLAVTAWQVGRPASEMTASTGVVTVQDSATTSAQLKVTLKKGAAYTFSVNAGYTYALKKPGTTLSLSDASGKVLKSSKTASLSLSAAESNKLANGDYTLTYQLVPPKGGSANLNTYKLDAVQKLSALPSNTGNADLNALLAGGASWWHDVGEVASTSNNTVMPTIKGISGARTTLYYDFLDGGETYLSADDKNGFHAMDQKQETAVVSALSYLTTLINVEFVQQDAQHQADLAFGTNQQDSSAGYAKYPLGNGNNPSVVMLDNQDASGATNIGEQLEDKTSYAWYTLIHEVAHSMGLKHPGPYNAGGGKTPGPYLTTAKDNRLTTVMSYKDGPGSQKVNVSLSGNGFSYAATGIAPTSYKVLDIAALQYLYGANTQTQAADVSVADGYALYNTLWAPQGVKLNASETTRTNVFDMRAGYYSSVSILSTNDQITAYKASFKSQGDSDAAAETHANQLVTGTAALKGKLFNGKNTLGLAWGSSYSQISGGAADDRFYASTYSSTVIGGAGNDTLYLQGKATDWTVAVGSDGAMTYTAKSNGAVITAKGIEAVRYYNKTAAAV